MFDFVSMSADDLHAFGEQLGKLSETRPDIAHRALLGFRDGLGSWSQTGNLGEVLELLYRQGKCGMSEESFKIPFAEVVKKPSGTI